MAAPTETTKMVRLRSSDGECFEVREEAIGAASGMIKGMLEEGCADDEIPLPIVTVRILSRVLQYVNSHFDKRQEALTLSKHPDSPTARFDKEFINVGDDNVLFDLILVANYLSIQSLLDLACKAMAEEMKGKTPEEIRKRFNIINDYPKEEEEEVRRENSWAFE